MNNEMEVTFLEVYDEDMDLPRLTASVSQVVRWWAKRADLILLLFDPDKPGSGTWMKGRDCHTFVHLHDYFTCPICGWKVL